MSELHRSFARAQLAKLPPDVPLEFDEREEDAALVEGNADGSTDNLHPPVTCNDSNSFPKKVSRRPSR